MAEALSHDALAADLAAFLRTERVMTWEDIPLGPSGSVRPDVYTITKSFMSPCPTAYECKVTRSDFLSDVTSGKWQSYLKYASAVYFACAVGLFDKKDVPTHCGLIVRHPSGTWRRVKRAVFSPVIIPEEALLKLLIDGVEREGPRIRARQYRDSLMSSQIHAKFGKIVAATVRDRIAVEQEIEYAKATAKRIQDDAQERAVAIRKEADLSPVRAELCEILGLSPTANRYQLERTVNQMRADLKEHPAQDRLKTITNMLQRTLNHHGWKEPTTEDED